MYHFEEQLRVHGHIESFGHVHCTGKDLAAISEKEVNGFKYGICAHVRGYSWLVGKLKVI